MNSILAISPGNTRAFDMEIASALGDINAAVIVQQLHYWMQKESVGTIIEGVKYVYNTFEKWVTEQFQWLSVWQFRKSMSLLRSHSIVKVIRHKARQWNQTNYYSLDYDRLLEFMRVESAEARRATQGAEVNSAHAPSPASGEVSSPSLRHESTEKSDLCATTDRDVNCQLLEMRDSNISSIETKSTFQKETAKPKQSDRSVDARQTECDRSKTELENIVASSFSDSQEKCDFSLEKDKVDTCGGQTELNGLKTDLKLNLDDDRAAPATAVRKLNGQEVKSARVEEKVKEKPLIDEKIKNKQWRSHLEQLDELGVQENPTIRKAVKTSSSDRVEAAIALYGKAKREGYISNPCGYFMQALKEDWARKTKRDLNKPQTPEDKAAMFNYWYDLAKEFGYCTGTKEVDGDRMVCMSGQWEKFEDAIARGYSLEYLRKVLKRTTNRRARN